MASFRIGLPFPLGTKIRGCGINLCIRNAILISQKKKKKKIQRSISLASEYKYRVLRNTLLLLLFGFHLVTQLVQLFVDPLREIAQEGGNLVHWLQVEWSLLVSLQGCDSPEQMLSLLEVNKAVNRIGILLFNGQNVFQYYIYCFVNLLQMLGVT